MGAVGEHAKDSNPGISSRRGTLCRSLVAVASVSLLYLGVTHGIAVSVISSGSMLPTLLPRDWVLVNRIAYSLRPPNRGDIIVFHFSQVNGQEFIKRIIGLPGDVVDERGGEFWVNGVPFHGPSVRHLEASLLPLGGMRIRRVPADQVFVLGDNLEASLDSRFWGTVDERQIIGKALLICWSRGTHWWDIRWGRIGRWLH